MEAVMAVNESKIVHMLIQDEADIYASAQRAKRLARNLRFDGVDCSRLETVTLELARNALIHGGGGEIFFQGLHKGNFVGLEIKVIDNGPGILDLEQAMTDGYSTAGSLGAGLGAARRLSDEFEITSEPGKGTRIVARAWHEAE